MQKYTMQKGFGLIGILIVVGIIAILGIGVFKIQLPIKDKFTPTNEEKSAIDMAEQMKDVMEEKNSQAVGTDDVTDVPSVAGNNLVKFMLSDPSEKWLGGRARTEAPGFLAVPNAWSSEQQVLVLAGDNDHTALLAVGRDLYLLDTNTFSFQLIQIPELPKREAFQQFDAVYFQGNFFIGAAESGEMYSEPSILGVYRFDIKNMKLYSIKHNSSEGLGQFLTDGTHVYTTTEYIEFPGTRGLGFHIVPEAFASGKWYVWDKKSDSFIETNRPKDSDFGFKAGTDTYSWYVRQTASRLVKENFGNYLFSDFRARLNEALKWDGVASGWHQFIYFPSFALLYTDGTLMRISL
ncbi:MAG: hypothetical protein A3J55_00730 [Candidatus Ryanbacteria bacterium RIFCSPHIGHO2_02_FULL_45_17b]|uniref:Uncharacterized protein n=1 Tax=Candidatus Ryanbacteria bacterium RIFCSPHIGHO2_01_FULL_45_22 TaxID=1802114 RepID=A0A1G2G0T4_9BACT|nr:MAG: hypothetical protein A2719_03195 [Candidatus Ryanbacteria bacterium RIFCSPHIGHO2_01_FULL_45_22]OGZ47068.1 MAG: hypothetical protein A3J55_00730 [Candidatus Ryanbacteria bacterium RIFCSPHIGHO2_02_FULL_45_17b]